MPRTVLIADESITIRSVAESLLRGESFSVHSAADGNMALEVAHAERPDLALIGEKLAGLGGADVCRAIKSDPDLKTLPIIFMRADRPGPAPEFTDAVLTKPFSPQSLLDAVHRFLAADDGRDGTAPVAVSGAGDPGLEDELIDQALGLDDVGSMPAEEREISAGRSPVGLGSTDREDQDSVRPFGDLQELPSTESADHLEDLRVSKALDLSFGLTSEPPAAHAPIRSLDPSDSDSSGDLVFEPINMREPEDEVDVALDAAFGEGLQGGTQIPGSKVTPAPNDPKTSLREVSLGEPEATNAIPPDRLVTSSAAPGGGIDLGGADDIVEDRPHDYDWFINAIQPDPSPSGAPRQHHEPPRIEPLSTKPGPSAGRTQPARPAAPETASPANRKSDDHKQPQRAYDDFISEFRAEIARIEGMAAPSEALSPDAVEDSQHSLSGKIAFEQTGDRPKVEPPPAPPATIDASIRAWGDELIDTVTSQVARELAAKIDSKVIYSLIEQKLKEAQKNKF